MACRQRGSQDALRRASSATACGVGKRAIRSVAVAVRAGALFGPLELGASVLPRGPGLAAGASLILRGSVGPPASALPLVGHAIISTLPRSPVSSPIMPALSASRGPTATNENRHLGFVCSKTRVHPARRPHSASTRL
jgi:hypothetical protein